MGRILAIDYGTKRIGLAVTDPGKRIATGLCAVPAQEIFDFLEKYLEENEVECFLVGDPRQMNNLPSQSAGAVNDFVKGLQKKFANIPLKRIDERFTSKMAMQTLVDSGLKKSDRKKKELVDIVSATILLQSYLESRGNSE